MSKTLMIIMVAVLGGCASNTGRVDFDSDDVVYAKDPRTGLCFAAVGSQQFMSFSSSGLGMTEVPCSKSVLALIDE